LTSPGNNSLIKQSAELSAKNNIKHLQKNNLKKRNSKQKWLPSNISTETNDSAKPFDIFCHQ
jgi:hypothetical protein